MKYDFTIKADENLTDRKFPLACGYYSATSFLFEKANFAVVINCNGKFTFYTVDGEEIQTIQGEPMTDGKGRYADILITTMDRCVIFKLPDYLWIDHYPDCDGESDRWDSRIVGVNDEIVFQNR